MRKEVISNELLVGIVVLATFISIGGSFMLYNAIQDVQYVNYEGISRTITGFAAGTANVTVPAAVAISLPVALIEFGSVGVNASANTTSNNPGPFIIQNDGSVAVDLTIGATDLFIGTGASNPSNHFRFQSAEFEVGTVPNATDCLITTWVDVPGTGSPTTFATDMGFTSGTDALEGEILITVPGDEPSGDKTSTVTFTASQAS